MSYESRGAFAATFFVLDPRPERQKREKNEGSLVDEKSGKDTVTPLPVTPSPD